jgi:hypothetical protein
MEATTEQSSFQGVFTSFFIFILLNKIFPDPGITAAAKFGWEQRADDQRDILDGLETIAAPAVGALPRQGSASSMDDDEDLKDKEGADAHVVSV